MTRLTYILLLLPLLNYGQDFYTNDPELINPILSEWKADAEKHGIDYKEKLKSLDSIVVVDYINHLAAADYYKGTIRLSKGKFLRDENKSIRIEDVKWKLYHEIYHHFLLPDCYDCRYNIYSGNASERALYLYRDERIKEWIDHLYFERIKNPKDEHKHF